MTIKLADRTNPDNVDTQFDMELSKKMNFDVFTDKVAKQLNVDPTHLRFSTLMLNTKPRAPLKRNPAATMGQILHPIQSSGMYGQSVSIRSDVLLYEVLELSLTELDNRKTVRVTLLSDGITKEEDFDLLVPKIGIVRDFIAPLKRKAVLSDDDELHLRFYEVRSGTVFRELDETLSLSSLSEFANIYAERTPQDELEANTETDRAIYCFHFDKEVGRTHGVPFKFTVKSVSNRARGVVGADELADRNSPIAGRNLLCHERAAIEAYAPQGEAIREDQILAYPQILVSEAGTYRGWYVAYIGW